MGITEADNSDIGTAQNSAVSSPGKVLVLNFFSELEETRASFYCSPGSRIIDMLNRADDRSQSHNTFLELKDSESNSEIYIRKNTILFVTADDANTGRGFGGEPHYNQYPVVEKVPVKVNVQLNSYRLIGDIYQLNDKTIKATLADNVPFLPLTDVMIVRGTKLICEKPFVAVNKRQIISLKKEPV